MSIWDAMEKCGSRGTDGEVCDLPKYHSVPCKHTWLKAPRRFKLGDKVIVASYPHASDVGEVLVVKAYDKDGVEPVGFPGWRLSEDSLIPWTAADERRLDDDATRERIAAEWRAARPGWTPVAPDPVVVRPHMHRGDASTHVSYDATVYWQCCAGKVFADVWPWGHMDWCRNRPAREVVGLLGLKQAEAKDREVEQLRLELQAVKEREGQARAAMREVTETIRALSEAQQNLDPPTEARTGSVAIGRSATATPTDVVIGATLPAISIKMQSVAIGAPERKVLLYDQEDVPADAWTDSFGERVLFDKLPDGYLGSVLRTLGEPLWTTKWSKLLAEAESRWGPPVGGPRLDGPPWAATEVTGSGRERWLELVGRSCAGCFSTRYDAHRAELTKFGALYCGECRRPPPAESWWSPWSFPDLVSFFLWLLILTLAVSAAIVWAS